VNIAAVIHHGIDVDDIPVGAGDGGYACTVGRMTPSKGIREAALVAREAGVPLRIAAKMREPQEQQYFDDCVRPLLGGDIEYVGELNAAEKYQLMGGAFALLNPIQWPEPFGLVMIEALACGTPVLATACGSAPEIVTDGDTGFVRCEFSSLVGMLDRAQDLDRKRCRNRAVSRFGTGRMIADHLQLYARLLESGTDALRQPQGATRGDRFLDGVLPNGSVPNGSVIVRDRVPAPAVLRRPAIPASSRSATVPARPESVH
jgi:glycosyltransferase involved in cell wall biosynthesis